MVDFLKANPFVSMEDYKWKLSVPMIKLMSYDNTRVHYLSEKQAQRKNAVVIDSADDLMNGEPNNKRRLTPIKKYGA